MVRKAEDIFQQMGIEGGAEAVTHAAATFIRLHPLYSVPPTSKDLSEYELKVLEEGGFPKVPDTVSLGDNIAIVAGEVGVLIACALTQSQAAQLLGVDQSRIRQRISQGTLYTIMGENNVKVLPRFQFTDAGVLPALEKVLAVINKEAHPIAIQRFFLTVSADLSSEELHANLSPRDWLITGHNPDAVVRMAADL